MKINTPEYLSMQGMFSTKYIKKFGDISEMGLSRVQYIYPDGQIIQWHPEDRNPVWVETHEEDIPKNVVKELKKAYELHRKSVSLKDWDLHIPSVHPMRCTPKKIIL